MGLRGLPFVAAANGCKLALPGRMDRGRPRALVHAERVALSGDVPVIWTMYLEHMRQSGLYTANSIGS